MSAAGVTAVEAPEETGLRQRFRTRREMRRVSFPELVWAHHLRQQELGDGRHKPYSGPAEARYRDFEARFEAQHGPIVNAYWCVDEASAVALTIRHRPLILPDVVRLHWATDWTTKDKPKLLTLLYRTESLAVRVQEVLRDTSQRLAMQSLFTVISFLLGFAETTRANSDRAISEIEKTTSEQLTKIESYYRNAAVRSGQIVYVAGMLLGMVPVIALVVIASLIGIFDSTDNGTRIAFLCFAAGSVGALVSVMARMTTNKVRIDYEFGKDTVRTLGALRPFVGGVFGLITYFALRSGVVSIQVTGEDKNLYFYIVFAFAAGFSERLAQDMLLGTTLESTVGRVKKRPDPHEPHEGTAEDELNEALPEPNA